MPINAYKCSDRFKGLSVLLYKKDEKITFDLPLIHHPWKKLP